ncbi:DUF4129 domain-containing protein [Mesonia sp. HuA40]|uniref:DUF4129 domain-containing protein n=1 Tax=Mesonia sp. HuA40 TaxID=2602761 RepID=UPI0011CCD3ED|nr:DUF4129 domain-containing protein [Mesonia sp. HuA40]TXK70242.1 DUF4129 domain-containing protein [Mesonia sp. HuA40]
MPYKLKHLYLILSIIILTNIEIRANERFLTSYSYSKSLIVLAQGGINQKNKKYAVIDSLRLEQYKKDKSFDYSESQEDLDVWSKIERWFNGLLIRFFKWLFGEESAQGIMGVLIRIYPLLIGGGLLGLIIWLFYKLNPGKYWFKAENKSEIIFESEEEIIKSNTILNRIKEAILNKNYRLATRYYYLKTLKELQESKLITYSPDKTNEDYLISLKHNKNLHAQFKEVTRLYDYIWYGNFKINLEQFRKAEATFKAILEYLKPLEDEK